MDRTSLERAIKLDPHNADYRDRLGQYLQHKANDPGGAVAEFQAAVQLNPNSAHYWLHLADAYVVLGETANQTAALEHAIQADPTTPDVAWEAGNAYLAQGEKEKALHEYRVVLASDKSLAPTALQICWGLEPDVDPFMRDILPPSADAYVNFLVLLENKHETAATTKVWNALMQTHESFEVRYAYAYVRYLIQQKKVDEAVLAWKQTADRFGLSYYLPDSSNLVVNSAFNSDVLNAGFDWQYEKKQGVTLMLDDVGSHAGYRSMLITFDGADIADAGVYQLIAVKPSTTYDFSGFYRNGEMQGAGGPHFAVEDVYTRTTYYKSPELKDAEFWRSVNGEFTTGEDCKLVALRVVRDPAGSPIRGKLWIDDFHIAQRAF